MPGVPGAFGGGVTNPHGAARALDFSVSHPQLGHATLLSATGSRFLFRFRTGRVVGPRSTAWADAARDVAQVCGSRPALTMAQGLRTPPLAQLPREPCWCRLALTTCGPSRRLREALWSHPWLWPFGLAALVPSQKHLAVLQETHPPGQPQGALVRGSGNRPKYARGRGQSGGHEPPGQANPEQAR